MRNIELLDRLISKHFKLSKHSNMTIGVHYKGENNFYLLNHDGKKEYQSIDYGIGSISKTFISTYLSVMVNLGEISLDDTIDEYFEIGKRNNIPTVLQLATHTSGYSKFTPFFSMVSSLLVFGFCKRNFYANKTSSWLEKNIGKIRFSKKKNYQYSDFNYAVLGRIIEKIKNDTLENIIIDYIQEEIQMNNTHYINQVTKPKGSWIWNRSNPFRASGGMVSTAEDMMKFLAYQMDSNNHFLGTSHDKYFLEHKKVYTGFSWNSFLNGDFYWHHGAMGYYRSSVLFDKKREISIVVLADIKGGRIQRMGPLTSQIYRSSKRNMNKLVDYFASLN